MQLKVGVKGALKVIADRVVKIAAISTVSSIHLPMSSLHRVAIALFVATSIVSLPTSFAFSPSPVTKNAGPTTFVRNVVITGRVRVETAGKHPSHSRLCASSDDIVNGSDDSDSSNEFSLEVKGSNSDENDEEEDDEVDIITQKLSRNAENGPINPMKEHDKMLAENELEANATISGVDGSKESSDKSVLYSQMLANAIDPDFDPDTSTDEAYVESQLKELLSRKGKELSRLGPGIATLPLDVSSAEYRAEEGLAGRELALQRVIDEVKEAGSEKWDDANLEKSQEKQTEILERAGKLKAEIDAMHVDDCGAVLLANLAFYEAFSLQDAQLMKEVWWSSPSVVCLHPSREALVGSNAVVGSFKSLFDNGMRGMGTSNRGSVGGNAAGGVYMTPTNIRGLSVRGTTASLVCDEEVYAKGSAGTSIGRRGGPLLNKLLTTNIFRKIGGTWKMVHRHASWHPETTAAKEAMKAEPGLVLYDEVKDGSLKNQRGSDSNKRIELKKLRGDGGGTSKRPCGSASVPESLEDLDANAVLGVPTPQEEEPAKFKTDGDENAAGMIGKIINLNDLLGGGSDAIGESKSEDKKDIGDTLADMLMGAADSDTSQTTGSGTPEDPFITRRVIRIGPEGIENLAKNSKSTKSKDEENSEDEDEHDVVIDLRDKSEDERKKVLSQIVGNIVNDAEVEDASELQTHAMQAKDEDELRQQCIATLRKLADSGLLSPKQKRILLTDIITSSARGETSMVEVAYELLCTGEQDEGNVDVDTGMEDFTEQCHVFAAMGEEEMR